MLQASEYLTKYKVYASYTTTAIVPTLYIFALLCRTECITVIYREHYEIQHNHIHSKIQKKNVLVLVSRPLPGLYAKTCLYTSFFLLCAIHCLQTILIIFL